MASTYSSSLNLELQTTGENSGSWGTKTNNNLQKLESAIKGYVSVAVASTTDSLTASDGGTGDETASIFKKESVYFAMQIAPRVQSAYDLDHLATSVVADVLFGAATSHAVDSAALGIVNFANPS